MIRIKKWIKGMKLRNQLIIFVGLTFVSVMLIIYMITQLQVYIMFQIYNNASKAAAQQQIWNEMVAIQARQMYLIDTFGKTAKTQMQIINKLLILTLPDYQCNQCLYDDYSFSQFKTVNISNLKQNMSIINKNNLLIKEWLPLIYNYQQMVAVKEIFWVQQDQSFTFYHYNNKSIMNYLNINQQYWYLNWINLANQSQNKKLVLSLQPVNQKYQQYYSLSAGLFKDDKVIGVISSQFLMKEFLDVFRKFNLNTIGYQYILTSEAKFVHTNDDGSYEFQDFYNESATGYNMSDWEAIRSHNFSNSNCKRSGGKNMVCRYNSDFKMDTIVSCNEILDKQFYLVSIATQVMYEKYVDDFFKVFSQQISSLFKQVVIFGSLIIVLIIIIIILFIRRLTKPLDYIRFEILVFLIKESKQNLKILDTRTQEQELILDLLKNKQFSNLINSYNNLLAININQNIRKSCECKFLQSLPYNSRKYQNYTGLKQIKYFQRYTGNTQTFDNVLFQEILHLI
ncbi:hypothetical protein pb186bvf_011977 [Paramecium bursaria]